MVLYHHQHAENNLLKQNNLSCVSIRQEKMRTSTTQEFNSHSENNAKMMNLTYP